MTAHEIVLLLLVKHYFTFRPIGRQIFINFSIVHFISFSYKKVLNIFF